MIIRRIRQSIGSLRCVATLLSGTVLSCGGGGQSSTDMVTGDASTSGQGDSSLSGRDGSAGRNGNDGGGVIIITGDSGSGCTPKTCQDLGFNCGPNSDGCGGLLDCGSCPAGQVCGAAGYSVCGVPNSSMDASVDDSGNTPTCIASTCASRGYSCGQNGDGCGGILDCGTCTGSEVCGGGGFSKCGVVSSATDGGSGCVPTTCAALGYDCGPAPDGCGGLLQCGTCTGPEVCGAAGFSKCGLP